MTGFKSNQMDLAHYINILSTEITSALHRNEQRKNTSGGTNAKSMVVRKMCPYPSAAQIKVSVMK